MCSLQSVKTSEKTSEAGGLSVQKSGGGVVFFVKVVPGSSKTALCGLLDGMLKVKVAAPPEKGKANKCLVEFLAHELGIKKNAVAVISGQTSAVKQIEIKNVSIEDIIRLLNLKKL